MMDDQGPQQGPCRVITGKHDPMFRTTGEVLYSYSLCQELAAIRRVTDGKREEMLPICDEHWVNLWDENGLPEFSIDSARPSGPVIEPRWVG